MSGRRIPFEQAVYGSFPFWDRGYEILAHSPGCRPEWLAELRRACQKYGEPPAGVAEAGGMFAVRLASGPWLVVGVGAPGHDDRGRPGALAFHALFVRPRAFRRAGFNPFLLAGALRRTWGPETRTLPSGQVEIEPREPEPAPPEDERVRAIVAALSRGRRVALESAGPIDDLARAVWQALPERVRRRASVATWAFRNDHRFDLVALPRRALAGIEDDPSYVDPDAIIAAAKPASEAASRLRGPRLRAWMGIGAVLLALLIAAAAVRALGTRSRRAVEPAPSPSAEAVRGAPDPADFRDDRIDEDERARVIEALTDLADRFGLADPGAPGREADPTALMVRLAERLRYKGPFLTPEELAQIERDRGPGWRRALEWHALVSRFAPDRPLPRGFAAGPLQWQLETLAWSFHLDEPTGAPRRSAAEVPIRLADALAVEGAVRPHPLEGRYPALGAYARFLGRLPLR